MPKRNILSRYKANNVKVVIFSLGTVLIFIAAVKTLLSLFTSNSNYASFVEVPVPKKTIQKGEELRKEFFEIIKAPAEEITQETFLNLDEASSYLADSTLLPAKPVKLSHLKRKPAVSSAIEVKIPQGMRALTLKVDATVAVEGWVNPGSIVDVVLINKKDQKAQVVAEKVKIISVEGKLSEDENGSPSVPKTVTLLVTQEQALAISAAMPLGTLLFTLRNLEDTESWSIKQFEAKKIGAGPSFTRDRVQGVLRYRDDQGREIIKTLAGDKILNPEHVKTEATISPSETD